MNERTISEVIAGQDRLLAALDSGDFDAIEVATAALAKAVARARAQDVWRDSRGLKPAVDHALRQNDAARMRVNILSEWTRKRSMRLAELRGQSQALVYSRPRNPPS